MDKDLVSGKMPTCKKCSQSNQFESSLLTTGKKRSSLAECVEFCLRHLIDNRSHFPPGLRIGYLKIVVFYNRMLQSFVLGI